MDINTASREWASRPEDERFISLDEMKDHFDDVHENSFQGLVSSKQISAMISQQGTGMEVHAGDDRERFATNYAFNQMALKAHAPVGYLRSLPPDMAAKLVTYGINQQDPHDVAVLFDNSNGISRLRAMTGPNYGRIWNREVVDALQKVAGDGVSGQWKVPGIGGQEIVVDRQNTTLYASDRDMFVFLADEKNKIEIPNRRDGKSGLLSRGFFVWNSEVGDKSFGFASFLFDYTCANRIVWGAQMYDELRIRHTATAPEKWLEEAWPKIQEYSETAECNTINAIEAARNKKVDEEQTNSILKKLFGAKSVDGFNKIHLEEEGRPIETLWDISTAITAKARSVKFSDQRVKMERAAGQILDMAA